MNNETSENTATMERETVTPKLVNSSSNLVNMRVSEEYQSPKCNCEYFHCYANIHNINYCPNCGVKFVYSESVKTETIKPDDFNFEQRAVEVGSNFFVYDGNIVLNFANTNYLQSTLNNIPIFALDGQKIKGSSWVWAYIDSELEEREKQNIMGDIAPYVGNEIYFI